MPLHPNQPTLMFASGTQLLKLYAGRNCILVPYYGTPGTIIHCTEMIMDLRKPL